MNPKIGIVVPVYKAEIYVAECIDSILAQTYTNFRLILVDDGTPDNAGKICDEYAKKDPRITVIHQKNAGVTRARARGVDEAEDCEFITFADADDLMPNDALETLVSILKPETEISTGTLRRFSTNSTNLANNQVSRTKSISPTDYRKQMILGIDSGPYCKLIKRTLFTPAVFDIPRNIIMGEDCIANTRIAFNNKKNVVATTKPVYYYRQHENSIMHTFDGGVEYEDLFFHYIEDSIPSEVRNHYTKFVVISKILSYDYNFGFSTEKPKWVDTDYCKSILNDINRYKIKSLLIERLLITTTNRQIRYFLIILKRIKNKLLREIQIYYK